MGLEIWKNSLFLACLRFSDLKIFSYLVKATLALKAPKKVSREKQQNKMLSKGCRFYGSMLKK